MIASDNPAQKTAVSTAAEISDAAAVSCTVCGEGVQMILIEKAARLCHISRRRLYRWVEEGLLHYVEKSDDTLLICGRCLAERMEAQEVSTGNLSHAAEKES